MSHPLCHYRSHTPLPYSQCQLDGNHYQSLHSGRIATCNAFWYCETASNPSSYVLDRPSERSYGLLRDEISPSNWDSWAYKCRYPCVMDMRKQKSKEAAQARRKNENKEFDALAKLLPLESAISGQLDKASVIRLTISYLELRMFMDPPRVGLAGADNLGHHQPPSSAYSHPVYCSTVDSNNDISIAQGKPTGASYQAELYQALVVNDLFKNFPYYQMAMVIDGFAFVLSSGPSFRLLYVNENVSNHLGLSQVELMGTSIFEQLIHKDDNEEVRTYLQNLISNGSEAGASDATPRMCVRLKCNLAKRSKTSGYRVTDLLVKPMPFANRSKSSYGFFGLAVPLPYTGISCDPHLIENCTVITKLAPNFLVLTSDSVGTKDILTTDLEYFVGKNWYELCHPSDLHHIHGSHVTLHKTGSMVTDYYRILLPCNRLAVIQTTAISLVNRSEGVNTEGQEILAIHSIVCVSDATRPLSLTTANHTKFPQSNGFPSANCIPSPTIVSRPQPNISRKRKRVTNNPKSQSTLTSVKTSSKSEISEIERNGFATGDAPHNKSFCSTELATSDLHALDAIRAPVVQEQTDVENTNDDSEGLQLLELYPAKQQHLERGVAPSEKIAPASLSKQDDFTPANIPNQNIEGQDSSLTGLREVCRKHLGEELTYATVSSEQRQQALPYVDYAGLSASEYLRNINKEYVNRETVIQATNQLQLQGISPFVQGNYTDQSLAYWDSQGTFQPIAAGDTSTQVTEYMALMNQQQNAAVVAGLVDLDQWQQQMNYTNSAILINPGGASLSNGAFPVEVGQSWSSSQQEVYGGEVA